MAGARLVSTRRTPWVRGPSAVVDAMVLGGITLDHEVYFERVVTYAAFKATGGRSIVNALGAKIDGVLNDEVAVAAAFAQDTDGATLLVNFMTFTYLAIDEAGEGLITDTVDVTMQTINDRDLGGLEAIILAARDASSGYVSR